MADQKIEHIAIGGNGDRAAAVDLKPDPTTGGVYVVTYMQGTTAMGTGRDTSLIAAFGMGVVWVEIGQMTQ